MKGLTGTLFLSEAGSKKPELHADCGYSACTSGGFRREPNPHTSLGGGLARESIAQKEFWNRLLAEELRVQVK